MRVRLKSQMFFSKTSLIENLMKKQKCFEVVIYNRINLFFFTLVLKMKTRGATESQSRNSKVN